MKNLGKSNIVRSIPLAQALNKQINLLVILIFIKRNNLVFKYPISFFHSMRQDTPEEEE